MKNYKVEAIMKFTDKEENIRRDMGDVFECTQERYEFLKRNNAVKLIEIIEEKEKVFEEETNEVIEENNEEIEEKPKKKKISKK